MGFILISINLIFMIKDTLSKYKTLKTIIVFDTDFIGE